MNPILIEPGIKVRFTGEGVSEFELTRAAKYLKAGEAYYVSDVFRDRWGCYIYVKGVPNQSFKLAMFEDGEVHVKEVAPPTKKVD